VKRLYLLLPLLFAAGFVLEPFAMNSQELLWEELAWPLGLALAGAAASAVVVRALVADDAKAGVIAALLALFVAGYGTASDAGRITLGKGPEFPASPWLLAVWTTLVAVAVYATLKGRGPRTELARLGFVLGALILAGPLVMLSTSARLGRGVWQPPAVPSAGSRAQGGDRPDVYFIILDGYGRSDVLRARYGCDNGPFLDALRRRGFLIMESSAANYAQTHLSIAASLNMTYLDGLAGAVGRQADSRVPLLRMIATNRAAGAFRRAGYRYATLSTGYLDTPLAEADTTYAGSPSLSHFAFAILERTPLAAWPALQYGFHRRRLEQAFEWLANAAAAPGPIFLFGHFTVPHHPFVYGQGGRDVTPGRPFTFADDVSYYQRSAETRREFRAAYVEQIDYVNGRVLRAVDEILARSRRPPVIVLQGDHGPSVDWNDPARVDPAERMPILNACLLPGVDRSRVAQTISPLNTMRLLAGTYAGADLPLLPDRSYYSSWNRPYGFRDVTSLAQSGPHGGVRSVGE
jgi:hypothetical protein